jgi:hypothetical protein
LRITRSTIRLFSFIFSLPLDSSEMGLGNRGDRFDFPATLEHRPRWAREHFGCWLIGDWSCEGRSNAAETGAV